MPRSSRGSIRVLLAARAEERKGTKIKILSSKSFRAVALKRHETVVTVEGGFLNWTVQCLRSYRGGATLVGAARKTTKLLFDFTWSHPKNGGWISPAAKGLKFFS